MKKVVITLLLFSSCLTIGYAQIVTTETQGLKRSSLLKVEIIKKPSKIYDPQNFIIGGLSFHPSQLSMYAMVGTVKKYGLYGKLKTDFNFNSSFDYDLESDENIFIKDKKTGRFSVTGGGMYRINNPLSLYVGLGYGNRWLSWTSISGDVYNVKDYSFKGLETETGLIYKLRNDIYLNMGLSIGIGHLTFGELNLGVGVNLDYLKSKFKKK